MNGPISGRVAAAALAAWVLVHAIVHAQDVLHLARTSWRCTTSARLDDPPRQGYLYFHPNGYVKMAQVVPASNRERANNVLWWRTREEYDFEDPTGRMWTDLDGPHDGVWASRRDHARIVYGSPPGLIILSVPRNGTMHARFAEPDARSRTSVDRGETDPFALGVRPAQSRSTMTCELRPGWLQ
jgi:CubicO group peptidase (beta-lactamase class C family)